MQQRGLKLILTVSLLGVALAALAGAGAGTPEKLRGLVGQACRAHDPVALENLVNWTNVSSRVKKQMKKQMKSITEEAVTNVTLASLPQDRPLTNELNGILYSPNIHIDGVLNLKLEGEEDPVELPYGDAGGAYYISAVVEKSVPKSPVPPDE